MATAKQLEWRDVEDRPSDSGIRAYPQNAAFPLAMFAIWSILVAIRSPSWQHDAIVLALWGLAAFTRLQLVVLLPAAFVAVAVALGRVRDERAGVLGVPHPVAVGVGERPVGRVAVKPQKRVGHASEAAADRVSSA